MPVLRFLPLWIFVVTSLLVPLELLRLYSNNPGAKKSNSVLLTHVLVCIAGQTRELMRPDVVESLENHVLKIISNEHMLHVALSLDVFPRHAVERARLYGNVYVNVSAAKTMFERRLFCNTCYDNMTSPIRWVICTRPDLFYFEDVPALHSLPLGVHMRTRIIVTTHKVY
jgi:hypothetical protein